MTERRRPAGWQRGPRYGGAYAFMGCPPSRDPSLADVAVIGLPPAAFDVVAVSSPYDSAEITARLAANLVHELLLVAAGR